MVNTVITTTSKELGMKNEYNELVPKPLNVINRYNIDNIEQYIKNNPSYFYYKNINDNYRFESLAYSEYKDSSYWDILFLINITQEMMYGLPSDDDSVLSLTERFTVKMNNYFNNKLNYKELVDENLKLISKENELKRKCRFIKKQYISDFSNFVRNECVYEY